MGRGLRGQSPVRVPPGLAADHADIPPGLVVSLAAPPLGTSAECRVEDECRLDPSNVLVPATDGEAETVNQHSGFGGSSGLKTQTQWREASRRRQQTNTKALCQPPPPPALRVRVWVVNRPPPVRKEGLAVAVAL